VIFLYHGVVPERVPSDLWRGGQAIPREDLEEHVAWLARRRRILPLAEYLERDASDPEAAKAVALTFDDGLRSSVANAVPVLRKYGAPATFFVTTVHVESREPLWFSYLNALCFEGIHDSVEVEREVWPLRSFTERRRARRALGELARASGDPVTWARGLAHRKPLPSEVAARYEGVTPEELRAVAASELFEVGSHTLTHPFLTRLTGEAQGVEIAGSRRRLAELSAREVRFFAYPAGDYDGLTLRLVREAGYEAGFATIARGLASNGRFEIERVGIYSPSVLKLRLKAMGAARVARRLGMRVG
jgi:peptidoglycan/xylan/chitin deacetylase (PgdA/CDA1 family)